MKKFTLKSAVLIGAALLALGSSASAVSFTAENNYDAQFPGGHPGVKLNSGDVLSDTFNLLTGGFVPGLDTATSGSAVFDFTDYSDPNGIRDKVSIAFDDMGETGGFVHDYSFGTLDVTVLTDINANGTLNYTITATKGDLHVDDAILTVDATVGSVAAVPDSGTTIALLGMSLVAVSAASRKFRFVS